MTSKGLLVFHVPAVKSGIFIDWLFDATDNSEQGERLTLITFFNSIKRNDGHQLKYHATEAKRI